MLKEIIQLSLVVALAVACNSTDESAEEKAGGVYIPPDEVLYWCTVGTPIEEKLGGLRNNCLSDSGAGKRNRTMTSLISKDCPTVEDIKAFFTEEHQGKNVRSV